MKKGLIVVVLAVACLGLTFAGVARGQDLTEGQEAVWVEGESAVETNYNKHSWYNDVVTGLLSGEDWLAHYDHSTGAAAEWKFSVEKGGTYTWWMRMNCFQIAHDYILDGAEMKKLEFEATGQPVQVSKSIDIRFVQWAKCGELELSAGEHSLIIMCKAGEREAHSGIDCMAFVNFEWAPVGAERPGGAPALSEDERKKKLEKLLQMPAAKATQEVKDGKEYIWIEGEDASKTTFIKHGWYDNVQKMTLSNRDWLSHFHKTVPGTASYKFEVKEEEGGKYSFWIRCNPSRLAETYSLDAGKEVEVDLDTDVRETMMISSTIDHRFMGWVKAGTLELKKGPHVLVITVKQGGKSPVAVHHGGIDCFALTNFPWGPSGTVKPKLEAEEEAAPEAAEEAAE